MPSNSWRGLIEPVHRCWAGELAVGRIKKQLLSVLERTGWLAGSGDLDLPGSLNLFVPRMAVVPQHLAETAGTLLPSQTSLIAEVASKFGGEAARAVKRRRYAEYGAPLYLLVDLEVRACTLFSRPGGSGYAHAHGPLPFGVPMPLPAPFDLELDTSRMG
ncbi:Uma2 family endonuclease [Streptomyces sp. NPDC127098]|uniref:Uma2 family endonuclease n=1 Tax=Streptomyces sp. NPDC127098 TaxID=3347137 RepID=UPI003647FF68